MNLIDKNHRDSSEDEEYNESESSDGDEVMGEHPKTADSQSSDEEETKEGNTHPYPTPPPDADSKVPIADLKASMEEAGNKMTAPKKKGTIYSQSLDAIQALNDRTGSSVVAIVKFIQNTGYENSKELLSKLVLRALKRAVEKGEVVQVKRSFKMSPAYKNKSTAVEKMKAKQKKEKHTAKELAKAKKEAAAAPEATENAVGHKMKASELKTNAPAKKKTNIKKIAAAAGSAKEAAGLKAQEVLEKKKKPAPKPAKVANAAPEMAASSKPTTKATSKAPRKSIGTLISTNKQKPKLQAKLKRKLVAGKKMAETEDNSESDIQPILSPTHSTPIASSTSSTAAKSKRKGRLIK